MLTAAEARQEQQNTIERDFVSEYLETIEADIRKAVEQGKSSCVLRLVSKTGKTADQQIRLTVFGALKKLGYHIVEHPALPGNDPREHAWDEVKW